jgi:hypothetical protein
MYNEHGISLVDIRIGSMPVLSVCEDGYSLSKTPVLGFDNSEVLARLNDFHPLISIDGSFKSEVLKTVFNIGLKETDEKPLWIVPNSIRHRRYSLLANEDKQPMDSELISLGSALHRQFASLAKKKDERGILDFAKKYGLLKRHPVHNLVFRKQSSGQQFQLGESLLWWKEEIADLAACLELWDRISSNDENLRQIVLWHRDGITIKLDGIDAPVVSRANMNLLDIWSKGDARGPALYYLSLEVDKHLLNTLTPKLLSFQTSEIYLFPDSLLAMIWLMFLWEIGGRTRFIQCQSCGEYFDARDPRARFCSTRCRMRNYRRRRSRESKGRKKVKES